MGKKIARVMQQEHDNFIKGAKENNIPEEIAAEVFTLIKPFAGYAFNKAHAVSYALIAYQTAYLKANYPTEFMAALLNTYAGNSDKIRSSVAECHRLDIPVLPPDINNSYAEFTIEKQNGKKAIRFSMTAIKNVGYSAIAPIISTRQNEGTYGSIEDFCRRANLRSINKKAMESLVKAGVLDCFAPRGALLQVMDQIISLSEREQKLIESGQTSMFDLWGQTVATPLPSLNLDNIDAPLKDKLSWEKELLGVYFSEHPLTSVASELNKSITTFCGQINNEMAGKSIVIAGMVTAIRHLYTKDGRPFIIATLEDLDGNIDVTAWSEVYNQTKELWEEGEILLVEGKVKCRDERITLNCQQVRKYQPDEEQPEEPKPVIEPPVQYKLTITIHESQEDEDAVANLHKVIDALKHYQGKDIVRLVISNPEASEDPEIFELTPTGYCSELEQEINSILGENSLKLEKIE